MLEQVFHSTGLNEQHYRSRIPQGRIGKPSDIAHTVIWLYSDKASYITGHIMTVDGGVSAG
jgi:NAD(P)-dependent dehydrogenase (short-subunit alcohol dehydrogenase family)